VLDGVAHLDDRLIPIGDQKTRAIGEFSTDTEATAYAMREGMMMEWQQDLLAPRETLGSVVTARAGRLTDRVLCFRPRPILTYRVAGGCMPA
jgi:hypothetical protein